MKATAMEATGLLMAVLLSSTAYAAYAIGSLAMFWVIQRSWNFTLGLLFS